MDRALLKNAKDKRRTPLKTFAYQVRLFEKEEGASMDPANRLSEKLARVIAERRIPVAAFERMAGLKTGVVRNILKGTSKKPSAETLTKIAKALSCSIEDLISEHSIDGDGTLHQEWNGALYADCAKTVFDLTQKHKTKLTTIEATRLILEVYHYSEASPVPHQPDAHFASWKLNEVRDKKSLFL